MKNKEKYFDEIMQLVIDDETLAVSKETYKPMECECGDCEECLFNAPYKCSSDRRKEWLEEEYKPYIDWTKVEVDTKVLVSTDGKGWHKRYFAGFKNGIVCTWGQGKTSWTAYGIADICEWQYAKLEGGNYEE